MQEWICEFSLKSYGSLKKSKFTPAMQTKHHEQVMEHVDWGKAQWNLVTLSDESKFNIQRCTNKYVTQNLLIHEFQTVTSKEGVKFTVCETSKKVGIPTFVD
jgi:hypothetical protein